MTKQNSWAGLRSGVSALALCLGLPATVNAADITYTGNGVGLQDAPTWVSWAPQPDTLFPGSSSAPLESGNHVTIDYDPLVGSPTNPVDVYGGASENGVVSNNNVTFLNGQVRDLVVGGLAWNNDSANNSTTISGGKVGGTVYGGYSYEGAATGNSVTIRGGLMGMSVHGGLSWKADATFNSATVLGGEITGDVRGGLSQSGAATDNNATVSGGKVGNDVYGGRSENGAVASNNAAISGSGEVGFDVYGGRSENGDVASNNATVTGGLVNSRVHGGRSENGDATGNSATVSDGEVKRDIYGGRSENGDATGNSATVSGGKVGTGVYGGYSQKGAVTGNKATVSGNGLVLLDVHGGFSLSGIATSNSVMISDGEVLGNVRGGQSFSGVATGNSATIKGGLVRGYVYGGLSGEGAATGNSVAVSGGEVKLDVYGGSSYEGAATGNSATISGGLVRGYVYGGISTEGAATGNSVMISDGQVDMFVYGGSSESGDATGNSATISGGLVRGDVYGGRSGEGAATFNSVAISGGEVKMGVYGGSSTEGAATGNSVTISGGLVNSFVYGGYSYNGDATGNSVTISGGTLSGDVYGGYSDTGNATYNTVTISEYPDLFAASLYGGGRGGASGDSFTGNRLNIVGNYGLTILVKSLANFEYYNFTLPAAIVDGTVFLDASDYANLTDNAARKSNVSVAILGGGRMQQVGESFILIDATSLTGSPANATTKGLKGFSLQYDFDLAIANNQLVATVTGIQANPETKALSEGRAGGAAFVNQGADMIAAQGMGAALDATNGANAWAGFGAIGGGSSRYNTGSHVNVDGVSVVAGVGWRNPQPSGSLLVGVFVEAGWGNYDSHNSFTNAPSVKGDGDVDYYGGGVLGRYDFASGLYGEGSVRTGRASVDFASSNLSGVNANYDSSSTYYGAHAGLGYILPLAEQFNLDLSTKYLWTRQGSDSVTVANDPIQFKASNSHRWRNGARIGYDADSQFTPYVGAAYEYEFDGEAKSTTYGYAIDAPSLKGGTGIGELGVRYSPATLSALSIDVGIQGYVGVREGVTGNLQVKYAF